MAILTCMLFAPEILGGELGFTIESKIWFETVKNGLPAHEPQHDHTVITTVKDGAYTIERIRQDGRQVLASDGMTTWYLVDLKESRNGNGNISPGAIPLDAPWFFRFPWFVYASHHFFSNRTEFSLVAPWNNPRRDLVTHPFSAMVSYNNLYPNFPASIAFTISKEPDDSVFREMILLSDGVEIQSREREFSQIKETYKIGFVGGQLKVEAWTNMFSLAIPFTVELRRFDPRAGLFEIYHCQTVKVTTPNSIAAPPEMSRRTFVTDFRYRDIQKGLNWGTETVTNNVWPLLDPTRAAIVAASAPQDQFLRPPGLSNFRWAMWIIVGALLLAPVIFVLKRQKKT